VEFTTATSLAAPGTESLSAVPYPFAPLGQIDAALRTVLIPSVADACRPLLSTSGPVRAMVAGLAGVAPGGAISAALFTKSGFATVAPAGAICAELFARSDMSIPISSVAPTLSPYPAPTTVLPEFASRPRLSPYPAPTVALPECAPLHGPGDLSELFGTSTWPELHDAQVEVAPAFPATTAPDPAVLPDPAAVARLLGMMHRLWYDAGKYGQAGLTVRRMVLFLLGWLVVNGVLEATFSQLSDRQLAALATADGFIATGCAVWALLPRNKP
jgi:hypothetical protein